MVTPIHNHPAVTCRAASFYLALLVPVLSLLMSGCGGPSSSLPRSSPPSIISQPQNQAVAVGQSASFSVAATGSAPLSFQWQKNGASIAGANSPTYSTGPTMLSDNSATFDVVISNSVGTVTSSTVTLTVGTAPSITSATTVTFTTGVSGAFTVVASGSPAPKLSEAGMLPSGVIFDAASGVLAGTPAVGTGGNYSLVFSAHNGIGSDAHQVFILTVNQPASITNGSTASFSYGSAGSFTASATGFPAPTFSELGALPPGVTLNSTTGALSGTPGASGVFAFTLIAHNEVGADAMQAFTLTVNKATLTVTANNSASTYGQAPGAFAASYSGFKNGDTSAMLSGAPSLTTTATASSPAGNYAITAAVGTLAATNYSFTFVNGTLTVGKATLTVTANNAASTYGHAFPTFTDTVTGFVNGDTQAVVSGSPSLTTTATSNSPAGTYAITAAIGTLSATNYSFVFFDGILTINNPSPTVSGFSPSSAAAGSAAQTLTIDGTNFVPTSTVTYNGVAHNATFISMMQLTIQLNTADQATAGNYPVVVTNSAPGGGASSPVNFPVTNGMPTVSGVSPNIGSTSGGTGVMITGTNFAVGATVTFGVMAATNIVVVSNSIITATTPAQSAGTVTVTVTVNGQSGSLMNGFTYAVPPAVSGVSPNHGPATGGTSVTIMGMNFAAGAVVTLGVTIATDVVVINGSTITATTPAGTAGPVTVTVTVNGLSGMLASGFTYDVAPIPLPPIKASSNNRFLVDQNNVPWLMVGDSAWNLMPALTPAQMAIYMSTRQSQGFTAIMIPVTFVLSGGANGNGAAQDGTRPFTSGTTFNNYDLSTPNPAYFAELDAAINLAKTYNLMVLLNPLDNYSLMPALENNGATKVFNYGAYLGSRYKGFTNIIWFPGNDFQTWNTSSTDNNLVLQLLSGIESVDPNHLLGIELNYNFSYSNQDSTLAPVLSLDMAYTYGGTYDEIYQAYNSSPTLPVFMGEANYEGENDTGGLPGPATPYVVRKQNYWTLTSGGLAGFVYGANHVYQFDGSWTTSINDPGAAQIQYLKSLVSTYPWWNLIPDQNHHCITSGYGTYNASGLNVATQNYATCSYASDGSLAIIYSPGNSSPPGAFSMTLNMTLFSGPVYASWFDPTNGSFSSIAGSPFGNSGTMTFTNPASNSEGTYDFVLVLQTSSPPAGASSSKRQVGDDRRSGGQSSAMFQALFFGILGLLLAISAFVGTYYLCQPFSDEMRLKRRLRQS